MPIVLTCSKFERNTGDGFQKVSSSYEISQYNTSHDVKERLVVRVDPRQDIGVVLLANPLTKDRVKGFYYALTGSEEISESIIRHAVQNEIPIDLAFSLAWVESRFSPTAVSRNHSSIDRGLFQLNSRSFPALSEEEFFSIDRNAELGLRYLKDCIEQGGNTITGLAMYNAGRNRVTRGNTPRMTLEYISRILEFRKNFEENFKTYVDHIGIELRYAKNETLVALNK